MSETPKDPLQPADAEARHLARNLMATARFAALGVIDPETGFPAVSRIALGTRPEGGLCTLVSGLSAHSRALRADPRVSLLVGEPAAKGDPLAHPRLTLLATASPLPRTEALQARWQTDHPKAQLYIDLPDFFFVGFSLRSGLLNGGFGRAFRFGPDDLS